MAHAHADVSIFQPHHKVILRYPALEVWGEDDELKHYNETLALPPIENSEHRYEPSPLVQDVAVEAHAGRASVEGNEVFSVLPATVLSSDDLLSHLEEGERCRRGEDLVQDMSLLTQFHGATIVRCLSSSISFENPATHEVTEAPSIKFKVSSTLHHCHPHGQADLECHYSVPMEVFDSIESDAPWLAQLRLLMSGTTDRDVRHMQAQLEEASVSIPASPWKPSRTPDYSSQISEISLPVNTRTTPGLEEMDCIGCTKSLVDPGMEPGSLRCNNNHIICKSCLLQWLGANWPDDATCPYCRQPIFTDPSTLDWLKFSVKDKVYYADPRYNDWENFVRSCADLDKELAENNDRIVGNLDAGLMMKIWSHLVEAELLELAESTPLDLQPARMPEYFSLVGTIRGTFESLDGTSLPTSTLYRLLIKDITTTFARSLLRSRIAETLSSEEQQILVAQQPGCQDLIGYRPGFQTFYERMVSRMLQFVQFRACRGGCWGGLVSEFGWHGHGLRMHFRADEGSVEQGEQSIGVVRSAGRYIPGTWKA